jgi:outer membrane protein TolC
MKKIVLACSLLLTFAAAGGQRVVTLWQCYDSAAAVTPLANEKELYSQMSALRDKNLSSGYLPVIDVNGSYAYYSDIPDVEAIFGSLPVPPGTAPAIPHQMYRGTLDLNQVIWDGGVTRSARAVEEVVKELNMQQNEAEIYRQHELINNYFFSMLLAASQLEVTNVLLDDLDARIKEASSGVVNGVVAPVTLDVLKAERIKAEQMLTEIRYRHQALIRALEQITGMEGLKDAAFVLPQTVITGDELIDNPDMRLFDIRSRQLDVSKDLLRSHRMPRAFGFAQAGYGLPPGNNFFAETPDLYYSVGVGLKWNVFDWNRSSNDRKSLTIQQELLAIDKSVTEEALQRLLTLKKAEIDALREAAESDAGLIALRQKIAAAAASQLRNGTVTASDYLSELNGEKQAVISAAMRQINISRAEVEYINITGINNK